MPLINGAIDFEYNTNIVPGNTAVSTSINKGRGYTVLFFVVGHFVFYTGRVYRAFRILDMTLCISPGGSGLGLLPFAAIIKRSTGGSGSRSAESGMSSAMTSSGASSSSSSNALSNLCNNAFLDSMCEGCYRDVV
jgi:hypothetical protein